VDSEMCEKCVAIDKAIERYRNVVRSIGDQPTVDRAKELIADLAAQKAALHPERSNANRPLIMECRVVSANGRRSLVRGTIRQEPDWLSAAGPGSYNNAQRGRFTMSKKAAEHHKTAAEHHTHAARHHNEAAKYHEAGSHEKAAHHAHSAHGHASQAREQAEHASRAHSEEHGKK